MKAKNTNKTKLKENIINTREEVVSTKNLFIYVF